MPVKIEREDALKGVNALNAAVGAVAGVLNVSMGDAQAQLFNGLVCDILEKVGEKLLRQQFEEVIKFYNRNRAAVDAMENGADGVILT